MGIAPENTLFIVLCFKGTDNDAMAEGLGNSLTCLTSTLAGNTG